MPSSTQSSAPVGWRITSQTEVTSPDAQGRFVSGVRVGFQLDNGTAATVFVPDTIYNPETVRSMVDQKAAALAQVAGLTG